MDDDLVELVRQVSDEWVSMDSDESRDALDAIINTYLEEQGYEPVAVDVVDMDELGYDDADGYYDLGSNTVMVDEDVVESAGFEDALATSLGEANHAASYQDTGDTFYSMEDDDSDVMEFTEDDLENFDESTYDPDGPEGYGVMLGDTLLIEAADEDVPAGHQMLHLEAEATAAELMSQATGSSSATAISSAGGGSEPGEGGAIETAPLPEFSSP